MENKRNYNMNAEYNFYRQIFKNFLPSWSARGGYIEGLSGYQYIYPEGIVPIPIQYAPTSSLDGLLIDIEHSPRTPQMLTNYIQTVSPGGIAIVHLQSKYWNKKKISYTFNAAGFQILYMRKIPIVKHLYEKNWIQIEGKRARIFFHSFPLVPFSFRGNWFVIAYKNFYKNISQYFQFSIILVVPEEKEQALKKIQRWEQFLIAHKIYNAELIIIENHIDHSLFEKEGYPHIQFVRHYENTLMEDAIYSGIYNSRGKIILVDIDKTPGNPDIFFELLNDYLQDANSSFPYAVYAYPEQNQNQWLQSLIYYWLYGISHPESRYRMYNQKCREIFFQIHPYLLKNHPYLIEKEIKKNNGKIKEIPYLFDYEPLKKK